MHLKEQRKIRITLEPELEAIVKNWSIQKRRALAAKLARWKHQLDLSANIMERDGVDLETPLPPSSMRPPDQRPELN